MNRFLLVALLVITCIWGLFFYARFNYSQSNLKVEILTPNETIVWPLHKDTLINVTTGSGDLEVEIMDFSVRIIVSTCPDKTCIKSGAIKRKGQMLTCAPNRVIIRIISDYAGIRKLWVTY
jgi:hypothetical protein